MENKLGAVVAQWGSTDFTFGDFKSHGAVILKVRLLPRLNARALRCLAHDHILGQVKLSLDSLLPTCQPQALPKRQCTCIHPMLCMPSGDLLLLRLCLADCLQPSSCSWAGLPSNLDLSVSSASQPHRSCVNASWHGALQYTCRHKKPPKSWWTACRKQV